MTAKMKITVAVAATMAVTTVTAQGQQSYQFEVTGGIRSSTTDTNPDIEMFSLVAGGEFHLQPVEVGNHPWSEAAFLEHSMSVMADLEYTRFELGTFDADGPSFGAGFRYATPDQPIAAEVGFSFGSLDGDLGVDVDQTFFGGNVGYWLQPNAIVGVELGFNETEIGSADMTETHFGGFGKIVYDLGEQRALNAEAHAGIVNVDVGASDETNFAIGVAGDFYFTPQYSAGAMLDLSFGDAASDEGVTFGVRGSAWFTPQVGVNAELSVFSASDNAGADETEFGIFANFRF